VSTLPILIQHSTGIPNQSNKARQRNKGIQTEKEVKLSLFSDNMILYLKDPKNSTKKLLALIKNILQSGRIKKSIYKTQ
jgi:hypothetical protein